MTSQFFQSSKLGKKKLVEIILTICIKIVSDENTSQGGSRS